MSAFVRIVDLMADIWRGAIIGAGLGIGIGLVAIAVAGECGRWYGVAVLVAGFAVWLAWAARAMRAQAHRQGRAEGAEQARRTIARAQAWRPPRHRFDGTVITAVLDGAPVDRRLISPREMVALAVIFAVHEQLSDQQIAQRLHCSLADVALLLAIAQPAIARSIARSIAKAASLR